MPTSDDGCGLSVAHNNSSSSTEIIRHRNSSPTHSLPYDYGDVITLGYFYKEVSKQKSSDQLFRQGDQLYINDSNVQKIQETEDNLNFSSFVVFYLSKMTAVTHNNLTFCFVSWVYICLEGVNVR